ICVVIASFTISVAAPVIREPFAFVKTARYWSPFSEAVAWLILSVVVWPRESVTMLYGPPLVNVWKVLPPSVLICQPDWSVVKSVLVAMMLAFCPAATVTLVGLKRLA